MYGHVVDGLFDGVITTSEGEFHVESASKYFDHPQSFHSIVYRSVDVAYPRQSCASQAVFDRLLHTQSRSSGSSMGVRPEEEVEGGRRRKRQLDDRFCSLLVAVDHLFLASVAGNSPAAAMSEVVTIISAVRDIYSATDFDNDGTVDQIQPIIAEIRVLDGTEPGYRYGSRNIGVNDFLDLWSQEDHTGFCLALLLTYRDFADGVLGLAWVAEPPPGNRGGICEERVNLPSGVRSLNTAITSLLNFGVRQPRPVTIITVAHEFGHNFGSPVSHSVCVCVCVLYYAVCFSTIVPACHNAPLEPAQGETTSCSHRRRTDLRATTMTSLPAAGSPSTVCCSHRGATASLVCV